MALDDDALPGEDQRHTEVRSAIDRIAEEAATRAGRRAARRAAGGYFALLLVLLIGSYFYGRVQESNLRSGLTTSCRRVNALRIESNRNAQVFWAALYEARQREQGLANAGGRAGTLHARSVAYIGRSLDAMRWTPVTDCRQAVYNPRHYSPPASEPFTMRFLNFNVIPK